MKYLIPLLSVCATPVFADCPDPSIDGPEFSVTGAELIAPQSWDVQAHGTHVAPCAGWDGAFIQTDRVAGFLPIAPTAQFQMDEMGAYILMVVVQAACDPVLAVRSQDGFWEFGETANGRQEAVLWGAPNGGLQVWVGSAERTSCDATVTLETFDR
ncbi:hypothetical protein SAMN05444287_1627 [Octadecabacter temperatus]|uniref:Uncharacterized protein n=1 Tax=Octadecabacter temperatus TaxID=1458307 RepID=A0A0K0Y6I8_9RHOB|nr:hypothetical protein [Octadecabacter temperatus]AKS46511.1 hypothetical protein OSB_19710 [Octadecabacter temperatus]SIO15523.1 hypothetical protein SAMN05444287_1627 [Octadecabacter temperatus]